MVEDYFKIYKSNTNILFVGSYPPPLGGVSVHIYRLVKVLHEKNYNPQVFNTSRSYFHRWIKYSLLFFKIVFGNFQIVHVHSTRIKILETILLARRFKKVKIFFTDHNPRLFENLSEYEFNVVKKLLSNCDVLIAVGPQIVENYIREGVYFQEKQLIINAFLPPPEEEEEKILKTYSKSLIGTLESSKPILISNAYQLNFQNNVDLYGLDLCIEVTKKLKERFEKIVFIFAIANDKYNLEYLTKMRRRIVEYNLESNFFFLTGQLEIWPLFKRANLFIRATYSDGYGVSIDEALNFNCKAIASNVCTRNSEAILFESRNIDDLYIKCLNELEKSNNPQKF